MGLNPTRGDSDFVFVICARKYHNLVSSVLKLVSLWPNWIRRLTTNQKIGGSSPSRDSFLFFLTGSAWFFGSFVSRRKILSAWMPEGSKGADLRSAGRNVRVGSNPTPGNYILVLFCKRSLRQPEGCNDFFLPPWPNG